MKKRELILVSIAILAGIYALFDYTVLSDTGKGGDVVNQKKEVDRIEAFTETAASTLNTLQKNLDSDIHYTIKKAESEWTNDPFQPDRYTEKTPEKEETDPADKVNLTYSGFIIAGENKLAVINGLEYKQGETVEKIGYTVERITPDKIFLLTDNSREIIVELEDDR